MADNQPTNQQVCPQCGEQFTPYNCRKNVIFCCYECQVAFNIARRREVRRAAIQTTKCLWCNEEFLPNCTRTAFCSDNCRSRFKYASKKTHKRATSLVSRVAVRCQVCGQDFVPKHQLAKYCSPPCRQKGRANRVRAKHQQDPAPRKAYQAEYRKRNNDAVRKHRLKNWYGMNQEEYDALLREQKNCCAICGNEMKSPHVDHDHGGIGAVRGLLCGRCNAGIGMLGDDPARLRAAADYIERHRKQVSSEDVSGVQRGGEG